MDPDRWRQIEDLYHAALKRASGERAAFLDAACDRDQDLRQEVESLLAHDEQAQRFITSPPDTIAAELLAAGRRPSPVGSSLGHYQILSLLGKGGMGEVYRARDARLSREVAIKLLPAIFSTDKDRLRRFQQEARAAGMLNHPNVLTIYDIGAASQEDGGAPYIVSELLTGETLRERLRRERLPLRRVINYALQIARGLAAAHEKGIVHRDLKPENLFLTKDGRVKILDFGLAKLKPTPTDIDSNAATHLPSTASGIVMGTVGYMAPEQVRDEEVDNRADIFAFGVILYEMITGRRAFQGKSAVEVMNSILKEEPPEISEAAREVPQTLVRVVRHCLEKSLEDRFQSVADIAFYLDTLQATADRETATAERARPRSLARRWMAVAAVAAVLAVAILIWQVQRTDEHWENPLANAHIERVTDFPGTETDPAISPDGKFIVFLSDHGGRFDAWVNQVGSGAFVNLTKGRFSQLPLDDLRTGGFTADGSHIWLRITQIDALGIDALGKETQSIWLMPTVGGTPRPFLERAVHAAWSP